MTAYDPSNIFSKIIKGEIPSHKVYEDADVLVMMDIFPQSKGHCLVISKTSKARNLLEVEPEVLVKIMAAVQRLTRAAARALKPDGVVVTQFNGAPAGQTIFHLHVHVIPRWEGQALGRHGGGMADPAELQALAKQIAAALD